MIDRIIDQKVKMLTDLVKIVKGLKLKGEKIVFTNGCFDIIHSGHIHTLSESKNLGTKLIVGINSDSSVKKLKGEKRPIQNEKQRALILASLSFIDFVIVFEEETPLNLIKNLEPNILVKGGDWDISEIVGADIVINNNGEVKNIPFLKGFSTTDTIAKILENK